MSNSDLAHRAEQIIEEAYQQGYEAATRNAVSKLETIAAVVPSSVTKQCLIDQCRIEADRLTKIAKGTAAR